MRAVVFVALLAAPALADDARPGVGSDEPTASDVANAPLPGQESGRTDTPDGDSLLRDIAQGTLLVPKVAVEAALAPMRATVWAADRYRVTDRFRRIFFDDSETYGLYPTAVLDSSYGLTVGARFVHRDLFGEREHFVLRGGAGGEFRAQLTGDLHSGYRFGDRTKLELRGELERRPSDAFYGIGNSTDAMAAHHRQQLLRATTAGDVRVVSALFVRVAGAVTDLEYAPSADDVMPIDLVYDPSVLTGWPGTRNAYGEIEVRWDTRRYTEQGRYRLYDRGWLVGVFGGRVHQLAAGNDYERYGVDVQYHHRLGGSARSIATRFHLDGVTGSLDEVAFTQLPELGGKVLLRGYPRDRFRDRVAAAGTLEYEWDLSANLVASLFVDAGRVFPALRDIEPTNLRVGYGMSFSLHSSRHFIAGVSLASSVDGGVFLDLSFDPVFDALEPREEQR
jgi:hypothetical protein